ncbi:MAG: penicillin-binding protein 1A [Methylococcaceae bacterium]|nr:penicillin-binding protein 1A [Methylococcaceae bacterium]MDP2393076.1 penicillin-binding protein 1A [Methylococcaceae bacterium]MDP3019220.1 penicillin-binding protein 1A [Methylococcaceae bacterium]MDP3933385.1 penicillin-binding protein 1A [Methylococcaceae bacterium]
MAKKSLVGQIIKWLSVIFLFLGIVIVTTGYFLYRHLASDLPDIKSLHHVQYQIPLSIYSRDKLLIAQFGEKKRIPFTMAQVPEQLVKAFLAAEDDSFFEHPGVDINGLLRAGLQLALTGKKMQGGSTITMQVTRNFLLNNEKTYTRKLKEIILALKIEREYSKQKILELYLNQIFMGHRAYGIAAAAQVYYDKSLAKLSLAEQAMIAGLPKAPSLYNPITNESRALQRRNYVLRRMFELNYISQQAYEEAQSQPSTAKLQPVTPDLLAPYLAEMVRQKMVEQFGDQAYTAGFKVYTTIQGTLQNAANQALMNTLHSYDERHGYRDKAANTLNNAQITQLPIIGDTVPAVVMQVNNSAAIVRLQNNQIVKIPPENIRWTNRSLSSVLKSAAVIRVRQLSNQSWTLAQVPAVEGAFVSLNPSTGAILALTGGFDFSRNKYNRVTQSKRQPGSGFKPIIYTTALEEGYTPASLINDAPIVIDVPGQENEWRPENYSKRFYGPTSLREAITHSRNIISIRLLQQIGIEKAVATAQRFGFNEQQLPKTLSLALGSGDATPLQMARVYATFANGGFLVSPYYIERIESNDGEVVYQAKPKLACPECNDDELTKKIYAPRIIAPRINFLMNSLLRDVVQRGTAMAAKELGRLDLAGKTGTTNEQRDAWFNGYTSSNVATAWVGFDDFSPLGNLETGGVTALPMWIEFMRTALAGSPEKPLEASPGIIKAYINPNTGLLTPTSNKSGKWEYFQEENAPASASSNHLEIGNDSPKLITTEELF